MQEFSIKNATIVKLLQNSRKSSEKKPSFSNSFPEIDKNTQIFKTFSVEKTYRFHFEEGYFIWLRIF